MSDASRRQLASRCAQLALSGVRRQYPNKLDHVMGGDGDVCAPRDLHPAFYGCYDWHSAVHAHWLLARILRRWHALPERAEAITVLEDHLTPANIAAEVDYLRRPHSRAFERTYGWAWALKLHEELGRGAAVDDKGLALRFQAWADAMRPLAEEFARKYQDYLPRLTYPVRTGVHPNTAFGLLFAWDWATWAGSEDLRQCVEAAARRFFEDDEEYPTNLEPSGSDFFSPCLMEAALMSRVLGAGAFLDWLYRFLPRMDFGDPENLLTPAEVSDRTDPQIVHLDGLNLSRAWCMRTIAAAIGPAAPRHTYEGETRLNLLAAADRHEAASLPHIASGAYEGEHWLGTFAMLAVDGS